MAEDRCHGDVLEPWEPAARARLERAKEALQAEQHAHSQRLGLLHSEIAQLQRHCADLTFEVVMKTAPSEGELWSKDEKSVDEALERSVWELEAQLRNKEQEKQELTEQIDQTLVVIVALEGGMRGQEREYLEEIKQKSHRMHVMAHELEQQRSTIAHLTTQLHHVRGRLSSGKGYPPPKVDSATGRGASPAAVRGPPVGKDHGDWRQSSIVRQSYVSPKYSVRSAAVRSMSLDSLTDMPDPGLFLSPVLDSWVSPRVVGNPCLYLYDMPDPSAFLPCQDTGIHGCGSQMPRELVLNDKDCNNAVRLPQTGLDDAQSQTAGLVRLSQTLPNVPTPKVTCLKQGKKTKAL
ncbi:coiled-coil domain-containing protein 92-like isoform X1 [Lethenteron reissneri]|uniref:coiled-coil domain-containing protein 92-like isoform X1 n=2 Tax=Lethenteron reissneri TaxID=7753 RepID=UPI002AB66B02|nr:coiled-coil domain-containing protein 92-like isoform X1 [Lethenteron reissneri]